MKTLRLLLAVAVIIASFTAVPAPKTAEAVVGWVGAGGSPYVGNANPQPIDINVSNTSGNSELPSIVLDSAGDPCIAWSDYTPGNREIFFARWNGTGWVNAQGTAFTAINGNVSNNSGDSYYPSLVLDSAGNAYIAWNDETPGNYDIYFARWNGAGWVNAQGAVLTATNGNVSNSTEDSYNPSLVLDSADNPCIAWDDGTLGNMDIYFARWNGANWVNANGVPLNPTNNNVSNDVLHSFYPCLALDSSDNPCIAWINETQGFTEIYYARWNSTNWVNASGTILDTTNGNVSNSNGESFIPSLVIDSFGNPCIAWFDDTLGNFEIYFARWNGSMWVNVSDFVLTETNGNLSNNPGTSEYSKLALDSEDNPCIAWQDDNPGNYEIYFARWNGTNWVNANGATLTPTNGNMSNNTGQSWYPSLALDSVGNPSITWNDSFPGNDEIYFAKFANNFDGTFTIAKSVDTNNDGVYDNAGQTVAAGNTLNYKINWQFNSGQDPLEEPYLYDTITDGTTYVSGSATPITSLSYSTNGGSTWIAGEPPNGSPSGTMLRWDLLPFWANAPGAPLTATNGNVSNNSGNSMNSSLALDSSGNPCIAWEDATSNPSDIYFARWNGTGWVNAGGAVLTATNGNVSNNSGGSYWPSLALDSSGNPCIAWMDMTSANEEIYYAKWNGANWVNASGTALTATNGNMSNNTGGSYSPSIDLDTSGRPCITWTDNTPGNFEIYFARWNGTNWINAQGAILTTTNGNLSNNSGTSQSSSLVLDSSGNPCIAWMDSTPGNWEIYFARWNGTSWVNVSGTNLDPTNGNMSNNASDSRSPSLALDSSSGNPCIAWMDFTPGNWEIYYARWNGTNWLNASGTILDPTNGNMSNNSESSYDPSLTLYSSGRPCIAWRNTTLGDTEVYFAKWNGTDWVNATGSMLTTTNGNVSNNSDPSVKPSLTLNSSGNPCISWSNGTPASNLDIFFAKFASNTEFYFSVQVNNPPTTPAFCNEATFRHKWDNGTATNSNTVCNTIDYNFTGTFNLKKSVETTGDGKYNDDGTEVKAGDTLNYKIDWSFDNPNNDPLFNAYVYDTVPEGTTYVAGSATPEMLSHSTDGGATWIAGEPPNGAPAGTRLRWNIPNPGWTNAKGIPVNSTNPNVSNNTGISDFPSLALDPATGNPCIAWSDDISGNTMVYYTKWNGNQWVNAAGLPFTVANGNVGNIPGGDPTLVLDLVTGYPWIAFQSNAILFSNLEIHIVKWNGIQWTNAADVPVTLLNSNVSNNAGLSWFPSHQLALDSKGFPCFVWKDNTTGSWQSYFTRWNGTNWVNAGGAVLGTTNGSLGNNIVDPSFWPTLVLDSNDNPYIAWDSNTTGNSEIYLAKWNGTSWVNINGLSLTPTNGNVSNNTGSSVIPYLAINKQTNNPCIAWSDNTPGNYEIYYAKWNGSGWVNTYGAPLTATNGNMSNNIGVSSLLSVVLDSNNLPCIAWEDDTPGNSEIFFARWNGTNWINALGNNLTISNGIVNSSPNRSWFPSVAINQRTNSPSIAWLDRTPGNNEVYFAKWLSFQTSFTFSVIVDKPFSDPELSSICNTATFSHVFDKGVAEVSNNICNNVKQTTVAKQAILVVKKVSKSSQYNPTDIIEFTITVKNTGNLTAENLVVIDNYPNELVFVSSQPSGQAGMSNVRFLPGSLAPNGSLRYNLKFKLSSKIKVEDCLTVVNEAIAISGIVSAKDSTIFRICAPKAPKDLNLMVSWQGINTKTGVADFESDIIAKIAVEGGSSPYDMKIDWGDGKTNTGTVKTTDDSIEFKHRYQSKGLYMITITCIDVYGRTARVTRSIH